MSGTLDRLAALASGTAAVVSVRPRSVFEPAGEVLVPVPEPVAVTPVQPPVPEVEPHTPDVVEASVPLATRIPEPVAQAVPEVEAVVTHIPEAVVAPVRRAVESVAEPVPTVPRPSPAAPETRQLVRRQVQPVGTAESVPASSGPAVEPVPEAPIPDVDALLPGLLPEHVIPALIDERVVAFTAVAAPTPRTDVAVVRVVTDPVVEQVVVAGEPQVHVHIGRVEVRQPQPTPDLNPASAPDLGAYLAARREDRR